MAQSLSVDKQFSVERQGKAIQNFQLAMPGPQADLAREMLKNPYNFDFLMLGKEAGERDLEDALTAHIQKFIMELGQGFAYMGRQFPIECPAETSAGSAQYWNTFM